MTPSETTDVQDLELKAIIGFDGNAPKSLRAHPNGEHIVYPFGIKVAVQSLQTHEFEYLEGHTNVISTVNISKTGKYIGSGQINHMGFRAPVIVWDWGTKKAILQHESHKVRVENLTFSSCENFVISLGGRDDANVVVFNILKKEAVCGTFSSNKNAGDALTLAAMHLRGICFISGGVYTLKVWTLDPKHKSVTGFDVSMRKIRRKVTCIEVDKTDEYAWCGTSTGDLMKVKLNWSSDLNVVTPIYPPTLIGCYGKHPKNKKGQKPDLYSLGVRALLLLEDDKKIVASGDGLVELIYEKEYPTNTMTKVSNLSTPSYPRFIALKSTRVGAFVTSLQLLNNGNLLVGTLICEMLLVNMETFEATMLVTCHTSTIFDVAFPSNYSNVFATASKHDVRVWSVEGKKELLRITVPNFTCSCVIFAHDGRSILTSWNDGNIRSFTPQSGKLIYTIHNAHNKGVSAIAISRDGRKLLSGGVEGQIRIWEIKKEMQQLVSVLKEHKGPISSMDIAPNNLEAATASTDGTVIIWDIIKYVRIAILFSQTLFMGVRYHPAGCQIITCGTNRQIGYWEIFDGSLIREVEGSLSAALNTLDISRDGRYIVTGGNDQYVKVWLYKEGMTTHIGLGHAAVITAVRISPDCRTIVSCSADGAIFVWTSPYVPAGTEGPGGEDSVSKAEALIRTVSPEPSLQSLPTRQQKIDQCVEGKEKQLQHPCPEGSIKCYCTGKCNCKVSDLPKTPKSRLVKEAEAQMKKATADAAASS